MPQKKTPFSPSTVTKSLTTPPASKKPSASAPQAAPKPANRWQRSKRYGWDSR